MDFDTWAQRGNRDGATPTCCPISGAASAASVRATTCSGAVTGEFVVEDLAWRDPLCEAFIAGAESIGIPRNPDYNGARQEGAGYFQRSIHRDRRMSTARAHLRPAMQRRNVEVRPHAHATRILFEGNRAVGVEYLRGGERRVVRAVREVIVSGGAVNSPQLLQLSGVGPPALLGGLGIPVRKALPGVGENLRDHYAARTSFRVQGTRTINELARGWRLGVEVLKYFAFGTGILTLQPTLAYCFWKSDEVLDSGDLQLTFTPGELPPGRAVGPGGRAGRLDRGVAATPGERRVRPGADRAPPRQAGDPAELPRR